MSRGRFSCVSFSIFLPKKTCIWNRGGIRPQDIDDLDKEVWSPEGVQVLGSPIGSEAFIQAFRDRRFEEERRLWKAIPSVLDLQCAWLLLQYAGPRCHHVLRTVPPSQSARYAAGHDEGMYQTMTALLGALLGTEISTARDITTLPMRLGDWVFGPRDQLHLALAGHRGPMLCQC